VSSNYTNTSIRNTTHYAPTSHTHTYRHTHSHTHTRRTDASAVVSPVLQDVESLQEEELRVAPVSTLGEAHVPVCVCVSVCVCVCVCSSMRAKFNALHTHTHTHTIRITHTHTVRTTHTHTHTHTRLPYDPARVEDVRAERVQTQSQGCSCV
jgi:hypothetical protein